MPDILLFQLNLIIINPGRVGGLGGEPRSQFSACCGWDTSMLLFLVASELLLIYGLFQLPRCINRSRYPNVGCIATNIVLLKIYLSLPHHCYRIRHLLLKKIWHCWKEIWTTVETLNLLLMQVEVRRTMNPNQRNENGRLVAYWWFLYL